MTTALLLLRLNLVLLLLAVVTSSPALPSPILTTKHTHNNLLFVGNGCTISVLDATTSSHPQFVATSNPVAPDCPKIIDVGLSTSGRLGLISTGTHQLSIVLLEQSSHTTPNLTLIPVQPVEHYTTNRVLNAVRSFDNQTDIYFIVANSNTTGAIIAYQVGPTVGVLDILKLPSSNINDIHRWKEEQSTFLVAARTGVFLIDWNDKTSKLKLSSRAMIATSKGNDGIDVTTDGKMVYIAAQGSGLRIVNMNTNLVVGQASIDGWAGGVKVSLDGTVAYVAADPGLLAFNVSIPSQPTLLWTCTFSGGLGWNIDVNDAVNVAYVSDNLGGMYIVDLLEVTVLSHYDGKSKRKNLEYLKSSSCVHVA